MTPEPKNLNTLSAPITGIVLTGLLAGTLDATAALLQYVIATGENPLIVFTYIASGVFGPPAFEGGFAMVIWGMLFHYTIAFSWTALFFLISRRVKALTSHKIAASVAYGIVVWTIMTQVVVPLSNVHPVSHTLPEKILAVVILILCIGAPNAWMAGKYRRAAEAP